MPALSDGVGFEIVVPAQEDGGPAALPQEVQGADDLSPIVGDGLGGQISGVGIGGEEARPDPVGVVRVVDLGPAAVAVPEVDPVEKPGTFVSYCVSFPIDLENPPVRPEPRARPGNPWERHSFPAAAHKGKN